MNEGAEFATAGLVMAFAAVLLVASHCSLNPNLRSSSSKAQSISE